MNAVALSNNTILQSAFNVMCFFSGHFLVFV